MNESDSRGQGFLSFKYRDTKRRAVKHVDFQVEEGSFFTIIGANGAGKSTLCNALVGLIPHYFVGAGAGHILIDGTDVADSTIAELSKTIGLVFQNPFNQRPTPPGPSPKSWPTD